MSEPDRRPVRVRRSPRVGVLLGLGAALGVIASVLITLLTPDDGHYPPSQVFGFLVLILVPVGAVLGGIVTIVLDAVSTRRARVLEAERVRAAPPDDAA